MVEVYKIKNNPNLPIIDVMFEKRKNNYNLRNSKKVLDEK